MTAKEPNENLEKVSFNLEELRNIKFEILEGRGYLDRVSIGLAVQILQRKNMREDYSSILDQIDFLEGMRPASNSKKLTQFKHAPLYPFWHQHFWTARHITANIGLHWLLGSDSDARTQAMIERIAQEHGDDPDAWQKALAHEFTVGAFEKRAGDREMTGDWIIFAKHEGKNYYLGVSPHTEKNTAHDDDALYRQLENGSAAEFPFLFEKP